MNDELFLFVRPPRPLWPFNGPGSAFWPPLAFASLAASLREAHRDLRVAILDAPALQMGWKSLAAELRRLRPANVGIGEEAVSCVEGLRLAKLARECGARVVAGGCFFGHVAPELLRTGLVDVVVHGEGEETLQQLLPALRSGAADELRHVRGISFHDGEEIVRTEPRQPIANLDRLPFPAYDLLPVERYGRTSRNHSALAAIELGRGCAYACSFCVLWRQMGRFTGSRMVPHLRTKSPERLREEIRILTERYGRRYLGWVDPCFNAHPEVPRRLAELLLSGGRRIGQSAWVRADCLVRDDASGALDSCVRAGLNEVYIGLERTDDAALHALRKASSKGASRAALEILSQKYPEVFRVGSFIYGLPGDSPASVRALFRQSYKLPLDMTFFIPLTPLPGTPYWRPELWDATGRAFRSFDFLPHVNGDARKARLTLMLYAYAALWWTPARLRRFVEGLSSSDARRRSINRRDTARKARFIAAGLANGLLGRNGGSALRFPGWYET